jgi:hypothetical protein
MSEPNTREMLAEAKQLEQDGQLNEAATIYQKIVDQDGSNQTALGRLLVMYRKLKEYDKELAVINRTLAAYKQRGEAMQERWIKAHPKAAGAGKAIFRTLGGAGISASGTDPGVNGLLKRKAFVEKRSGGVPAHRPKPLAARGRKKAERAAAAEQKRNEREERKQAAAAGSKRPMIEGGKPKPGRSSSRKQRQQSRKQRQRNRKRRRKNIRLCL